jgi:hypothetical protein
VSAEHKRVKRGAMAVGRADAVPAALRVQLVAAFAELLLDDLDQHPDLDAEQLEREDAR